MIKGYHNDNVIFNTSDFMENQLKNQQKKIFIGDGALHKNVEA